MKKSPAELLKAEIMERYGLKADQVQIEVTVFTANVELGQKILADHDIYHYENRHYLSDDCKADVAYGNEINSIWVHKRDGRYTSDDDAELGSLQPTAKQ